MALRSFLYASWIACLLQLVLAAVPATGLGAGSLPTEDLEFFERSVRPLLVKYCYECHSAGAKPVQGGLLLDSRDGWVRGGESGPTIVPGDPENSLLVSAVRYEDFEMPPEGRLPQAAVRILEEWVRRGAPDPRSGVELPERDSMDVSRGREHWAFQAVGTPELPEVTAADWPSTAVDHFVLAQLETRGLAPVADASGSVLLRRLCFDLTGLPPTFRQTKAVLIDDSPRTMAALMDQLLGSPEFGRKWGRHWLDVARYADSNGLDENCTYFNAWRYRNWVIGALNEDKPFRDFLIEQIAGDLLPFASQADRDRKLIATGFLVLGPKPLIDPDKRRLHMDVVDEQINTVGRAFLGLNVGCARCHDHKFDPIPTRDYYALAGIFSSTATIDGKVLNMSGWSLRPLGADGDARYASYKQEYESKIKPAFDARKRAGGALDQVRDQVEQLGSQELPADLRDKLTEAESAYESAQQALDRILDRAPRLAMAVRDVPQPADAEICIRGDPHKTGDVVPRGFPQVLCQEGEPIRIGSGQSGRLELAQWLVSARHRLAARVAVNRVWQRLFGVGLVPTVDDFGVRGSPPTHPLLLDYLSHRFVESGWSTKALIREIVASRVYRLATERDSRAVAIDPENRWLWRMNRRRLSAEAIRDAALAVSGTLDQATAESPVDHLWFQATGIGVDPIKPRASRHRSVFLPVIRNNLPDVLEIFDFADPQVSTGQRTATNVAPQALFLLNSSFIRELSEQIASQMLARATAGDRQLVCEAYERILNRPPRREELQFSLDYLAAHGEGTETFGSASEARALRLAHLCQALFSSTSFQFLD